MDKPALPQRVADEQDLCRVWAAQAFPRDALITTSGERLQVVYPGRRSGMEGPDFTGAILADALGRMRCGDVEIHLRSRDWLAHGHRADPAYDGVILHVVLEDDGSPCLCSNGTPVPVVALGPLLAIPLPAVPAELPIPQPCRVSPALTVADVSRIVRGAGRTRLERKAAALEAQIAALGAEQALFTALLDAAGYSRNRIPCARLAASLSITHLRDLLAGKPPQRAVAIATAVMLGAAGLLPPDAPQLSEVWQRHARLWPPSLVSADSWVRAGVRPANRPEVRLRGIAALVARYAETGLVEGLLEPLRRPADGPSAGQLLSALEVAALPGMAAPAIGRSRAVEMAVNVAIPFALALARAQDDAVLEEAAWRAVERVPAGEESSPVRDMRDLLASSGHRLRRIGALDNQGLLHLHRTYCGVRACWDCPLAVAPASG